jgi:type IX secretion system PorP/SprF family membrane protein
LVFSFLLAFTAFAQQDPLYTQYMFNPLNYNPAYAGNKSILSAALIHRQQWVGIDGAPQVTALSVHSPLKNKNMGVGLEITNDQIGPMNNLWIQASYAYRIKVSRISKGKIGFGLKAGVLRTGLNWNKIRYKDQDDQLIGANTQNFTSPVFDFGIYYHITNKLFAGGTIKNLNAPKYGLPSVGTSGIETRQLPQLLLTYGHIFELNDRVVFRPSLLFRYTTRALPMTDINLSLLFDQTFWVGISYRTSNTVAAILEYEITEQIKLGYSYDYDFNELSTYSTGSHEIFLGFNYNVFRSRMRSPRYYF